MWILLENIKYEVHDRFIAGWQHKPTHAQLNKILNADVSDKTDIRKLKQEGSAETQWGAHYTLTKYTLGDRYR